MPAPVVVEVYAPQPSSQELAVLLAACSRAATPHDCIDAEAKGSEPPLGVAIVRRDGERARIELGLRSVVNAQWSTRDLVFQAGDDELERYRAIGFAIGTLVARESEPPSPPPTAAPAVVAPPAAPAKEEARAPERAPTPAAHRPRSAWLDASGGVGLGLVPGPPRAGGSLRAALELVPRGVFGLVEGGYAERSGEPSLRVRWLSAALGLGHPLAPNLRSLGVDVRLSFALEQLSVTAVGTPLDDHEARWKPGVTAAIDGHWDVAPPLSLLISASTFIDPRRTVIKVGGVLAGETPALGLGGFLGLRFKLR